MHEFFAVRLPCELIDDNTGGIGKLFAQKAKKLFTNQFRGDKSLAAVGDFIFSKQGRFLGQIWPDRAASDPASCVPFSALTGTIAAKANSLASFSRKGSSCDLSASRSILLMARITGFPDGRVLSPACRGHRNALPQSPALPRPHPDALGNRAIHCTIQAVRVLCLKTGRINKNELGLRVGHYAVDAMAGGLGFFGSDTDFLPYQPIEQCRFADVGATHYGDISATIVGWGIRSLRLVIAGNELQ